VHSGLREDCSASDSSVAPTAICSTLHPTGLIGIVAFGHTVPDRAAGHRFTDTAMEAHSFSRHSSVRAIIRVNEEASILECDIPFAQAEQSVASIISGNYQATGVPARTTLQGPCTHINSFFAVRLSICVAGNLRKCTQLLARFNLPRQANIAPAKKPLLKFNFVPTAS